ncbi:site-specific DNA-methyltransferase [Nitrosovibrio tenuis]|uniref:site-specific DNA-methyltransferase (adenine-specific) n=1 Tax=Nitrosovibrio tenuis TaxID=1233 RepID=A0A1H7K3G9_9PROT|nr:DNA methyltransferase [Nitrosovibrio tenuis]SEK80970.1 adenine-specific DNA-methyltransferase [Nitrosovibrio tenuis]
MTDPTNNTKETVLSPNPVFDRRAQLAALIPEAFSEGTLDIAALKRALGGEAIIEGGERYALTWAGKANAYKVLQSPSTATLRPQRDLSVNFDDAPHVFIEGENLEVLKVLQKAYFGKVKLIYIDPPYNTGSDSFIYPDRFLESKEDYLRRINDLADDGTLMREGFFRKNSKENGHYHSNWLSMMLPRLYIARNLLSADGVIFVSCDDNEMHNLRLLMNEVFGEEHFVSQLVIINNLKGRNDKKNVATCHEYMLVFSRNGFESYGLPLTQEQLKNYKYTDARGKKYALRDLRKRGSQDQRKDRPKMFFPILYNESTKKLSLTRQSPDDVEILPKRGDGSDGRWRWGKDSVLKNLGILEARYSESKRRWDVDYRIYLEPDAAETEIDEEEDDDDELYERTSKSKSFWRGGEISTDVGKREFKELFQGGFFDYPKSPFLMRRIIQMTTRGNDLILDFFAGTGTMAQAVLDINQTEGTARRFVCVQLPELIEPESDAGKAGFGTLAEVCRERIKRSIRHVETAADLATPSTANLGFKSFLLTPSNFKQWRGDGIDSAEQLAEQMQVFVQTEKDGAAVEHLLYELLLKCGQELTTPVETLDMAGGQVFAIRQRNMLFVLASFTEAMIQPLVDLKPREIIAIDGVFQDSDSLKSNLDLQCRDMGIKFTCL